MIKGLDKMIRNLDVSVWLSDENIGYIDVLDEESGICKEFNDYKTSDKHELATAIGYEILSWLELMRDQYEDYMEDKNEEKIPYII